MLLELIPIMNISIRISTSNDLDLLEEIEQFSFPAFQRSARRGLQLSLTSPFQKVWLAETKKKKKTITLGALILHLHKKTLRIYSIAVLPEFQGHGVGLKLLNHACNYALAHAFSKITLEASSSNKKLIAWYEKAGFVPLEEIKDYYCPGENAVRMVFEVPGMGTKNIISNIIVVDKLKEWTIDIEGVQLVAAKQYITSAEFQVYKNIRVFNLCSSYRYQSLGYYVSLLASAREHRAIPNVTTIRDFKDLPLIRSIATEIDELIQVTFQKHSQTQFSLNIYFGHTIDNVYQQLGSRLYSLFEAPLLHIEFRKMDKWLISKVLPLSLKSLDTGDQTKVQFFAQKYFAKKRFTKQRLKNYKYDLAILIKPNEANPPSCPLALKEFKIAAEKTGFYTEFITRDDLNRISEFDALFIRETTNVNDYTYKFSRMAYAEGLVVIDDPWSILRCSNKIYLHERLKQNGILTPPTWVLTKGISNGHTAEQAGFPMVLKQPDSAFSLGVVKVENEEELKKATAQLFKKSDLIIVQQFLPSEYDWRIGVLDQTPLFACKYFMAKGHWQIYNWDGSEADNSGVAETVPMELVPEKVLKTAVKAASLMGDGLYGVDLKQIGDKVYLIEVNDNPNIDYGIEDDVLKNQLYEKIMQSIYNRIEMSRNIARFVSVEPD
ncbi:MAG: GNAT family N-acetyltransferase [Bacteroidales bacterium]|nr:GNAT family N-acetyltransferase [Bacteroidales bacterium]